MKNILPAVNKKQLMSRVVLMITSLILGAVVYNIFLLPLNIVSGGVSGVATITKHLYNIDPALMIFILSTICSIISLIFLGVEKTTGTIVSSLLYPILVKLTSPLSEWLSTGVEDIFIVIIFAGVLSGIANGLMYRSGYTNGGFPVICSIIQKYFKIPVSKSSLLINLIIVFFGGVFFGSTNAMYTVILLYINSIVLDKVLLGVSKNKAFYISTYEEKKIKEYIINNLRHTVTTFDTKGGFMERKRNIIFAIIPSKEYYKVTEIIKREDPDAFFIVTDSYEIIGGK